MNPAYFLSIVAMLFLSGAAANCSKGVRVLDPQDAMAAGDVTALVEGCGRQLSDGVLVCRKNEGDATADQWLTFSGPATECLGVGACVTFRVFMSDGSPDYAGEIPRGQTSARVSWTALTHHDLFTKDDRGFWPYQYVIRFLDSQGIEHTTYTLGDIYMRVVAKNYLPLHANSSDPNFVWQWVEGKSKVKMTTGGRTWVSDDPTDGGSPGAGR